MQIINYNTTWKIFSAKIVYLMVNESRCQDDNWAYRCVLCKLLELHTSSCIQQWERPFNPKTRFKTLRYYNVSVGKTKSGNFWFALAAQIQILISPVNQISLLPIFKEVTTGWHIIIHRNFIMLSTPKNLPPGKDWAPSLSWSWNKAWSFFLAHSWR